MSLIIYIIENAVSPAVYIGKTVQLLKLRWGVHKAQLRSGTHGNPHMQAAWSKYGESAFSCRVLQAYETVEELNRAEVAAIALYRASGAEVYNATDGGEGVSGRIQTQSEREMRSRAARKALSTPEARQRRSEVMLKRWSEPGARAKQSERMRGVQSDEVRRHKGEATARYWNDSEHRQRRIDAIKEAWQSPEARQRKSDGNRERYTDPAERQKTSDANRKRFEVPSERERASRQMIARYGYTYTLIAPDGRTFTTNNLLAFCKEHALTYRCMLHVCVGKQQAHMGWTGSRTKEEAPP